MGINETISYTAKFENGIEADIKCCGVDYEVNNSNTAWTEAVLFNNGCQICCSEPSDHYFGTWILEDNDNNTYIVNVQKQSCHEYHSKNEFFLFR